MTWSYSTADLATSPKDQVRLQIGDTLSADPQLQDEEIAQFIAGRSTLAGACADACRSLASKFSRSVDQGAAGPSYVKFSQMAAAYLKQAVMFDQIAARSGSGLPYAGGISVSDKETQESNTDRVAPQFNIGMDDNQVIPEGAGANETESYSTPSVGPEG